MAHLYKSIEKSILWCKHQPLGQNSQLKFSVFSTPSAWVQKNQIVSIARVHTKQCVSCTALLYETNLHYDGFFDQVDTTSLRHSDNLIVARNFGWHGLSTDGHLHNP